jgi:DNA (cytosine-5)-methyltransferase 1
MVEESISVLDLFCGAGGFAQGFKHSTFDVTGVDNCEAAGKTFELNNFGLFKKADLKQQLIVGQFDVIIGGPPCRPWSAVNTSRRGVNHPDFILLSRFFEHVAINRPKVFVLENVPLLRNEATLKQHIEKLQSPEFGYSIMAKVIKYSDYGATTNRRRFIIFGSKISKAEQFFNELTKFQTNSKTVKSAIWQLRTKEKNEVKDHIWPNLKTIDKYLDKYKAGRFGWYILDWSKAAPSFGNIMKTYILHPDAFKGGAKRVLSVKEAALIMGFADEFIFPEDVGIGLKYQMIVDSVSPVFSEIAAKIIQEMLSASDL